MEPKGPYQRKFKSEWLRELTWLQCGKTDTTAFCKFCNTVLNITRGGLKDLKRHGTTSYHMKNARSVEASTSMANYVIPDNNKQVDATLHWANFVTENNLSINLSDKFSKLVPKMFPDSDIAKNFKCGRTKTGQIIEQALGATLKEDLISKMKASFFTLLIDESTDKATLRQMVIMIRMFADANVETYLYEVVSIEGAATGENLFNVVSDVFNRDGIPWEMCLSMSSDGARAMVGEFNSVLSRVKKQQGHVWFLHCTCHVAHLAASHACNELPDVCEQFTRDVYAFFKTSGKRQFEFRQIQERMDLETNKILRPCFTRWLAMLQCVTRVLEQWSALETYFNENLDDKESKLESVIRMKETLSSDCARLYFLFLESILPRFTKFNLMFQHERPYIHKLHKEMCSLLRQFLASFVQFSILQKSLITSEVDYSLKNQLSDEGLFIGNKTRSLLETGTMTTEDKKDFFRNVRDFYEMGAKELYRLLPWKDEVLINVPILDPVHKSSGDWDKIHQLAKRFPNVIGPEAMDKLNEEFMAYSLGESDDNPSEEIDSYWSAIAASDEFPTLCKLAKAILILPHSNAQVERCFSTLTLIKTCHRTRLASPMLNALMMCANRKTICDFNPTNAMRKRANHLKKTCHD